MNILLVGSGGREHALAWKIAQSPLLTRLVCAPGNPGIAAQAEIRPVKATDVEGLVALAKEIAADLVVIGPESAVEAGVADGLGRACIPCFGPSAAAGRLETSKAFAKDFAMRHGLPTAAYGIFDAAAPAKAFLDRFTPPYVIKADGLAAGKGVAVAETRADAEAAIDERLGGAFGAAGARVVIEEFLVGEIASQFALCDGRTSLLFGGAQDHKRALDGEKGPNTGGMGTYAPAPVLSQAVVEQARTRLIEPAFAGIAAEGAPYRGALFCEMMATADGPKLIEFNVRFGDPECQVLMLRLASDLVPYLMAAATGTLATAPPPVWRDEAAICVVLAAKGYPAAALEPDSVIRGVENVTGEGVVVFHAATRLREDGTLVSSGGRTLNVCATGSSLEVARDRAYAAIEAITWPGGYFRHDIGWRALQR
ncbi:MAG TPA: phosphoribosylamine--glycine ligase [Caulobacteraceae bacterium]|nr:phosphoribosylamine--glycine ligase [Caulobacteraceae bacterium]